MISCCWQLRVITYLFNGIFSIPLWHGLLRIFRLWENAVFPYLVRTRVHVLIIVEALSSIFWKLLTICVCFLNSYVVVNLGIVASDMKQDLVWKYLKVHLVWKYCVSTAKRSKQINFCFHFDDLMQKCRRGPGLSTFLFTSRLFHKMVFLLSSAAGWRWDASALFNVRINETIFHQLNYGVVDDNVKIIFRLNWLWWKSRI